MIKVKSMHDHTFRQPNYHHDLGPLQLAQHLNAKPAWQERHLAMPSCLHALQKSVHQVHL